MKPTHHMPRPGFLQRRVFLGSVLPGVLLSGSHLYAQELSAMEKIRARGTLKVALYKDNQPYSDGNASNMRGVDVSVAEALSREIGLGISFLPFDAGENMGDDLRNMVWKGHYLGYGPADVMLHVPVDKYFMQENRQAFIFSPYAREHLVVFHSPKTIPQVYNPEDLMDARLVVEQGTGAASALLGYKGGLLRNKVSIFKNGIVAAQSVIKGDHDGAFISLAQAEAAVFAAGLNRSDWRFSKIVLPGVPPTGWPLGMAVKADNKELAALLDKAMDAIRSRGDLLKIYQSHGLTLAAP